MSIPPPSTNFTSLAVYTPDATAGAIVTSVPSPSSNIKPCLIASCASSKCCLTTASLTFVPAACVGSVPCLLSISLVTVAAA